MSTKLLKSTAVVSVMTFVSRVLGFVRDIVIANLFGAGKVTDAFFVAFKIPNFLRRLFAEGAFSQAFVPVLGEYRSQRSQEEVKELVDRVAGTLGGVLLAGTLVGVLAAPVLIFIFAPGWAGDHQDTFDLAVHLLRYTFPYLLFISLTAFAAGILNTYGRFAIPALTPVWLNVVLILAALGGRDWFAQPITALAAGVFVAGLVQVLFMVPSLCRLGLFPRFKPMGGHEGVRKILKLMLPAIFGSSVAQINLLLDTLIASFLVTGSVSWLYYSDRLVEFPLGVFGIALATVILPSLSRRHAEKSPEQFSHMLDWALRWAFLIGLPATVALIILAAPMLTTLFQYGEFSRHDVIMSSISLMAYSLGLLGFILVKVLAPGFYARQDTRTPVRVGVIAMLSNMLLNVIFVVPMVLTGFTAPHAGLALATASSAFVNAGLLYYYLRRDGVFNLLPGWSWLMLRMLVAVAAMSVTLYYYDWPLDTWLATGAWGRALHLAELIISGAGVYVLMLLILGVRPWAWRSTPELPPPRSG